MSTNYLVPDQDKLEWQKPIENRILTAPPTPVKGKRYIVASIATGDWVGQENNIAIYNGSTWDFIIKKEGMKLWDKSENLFLHYDGTNWVPDIILYQTVAEYLDQYNTQSNTNNQFEAFRYYAQTFKVSRTGILNKAVLRLEGNQTYDVIVTICEVDENNYPTNSVLSTTTILAANIPTEQADVEFIFSTPANVMSGVTYAIVCTSLDGGCGVFYKDSDVYINGSGFYSANNITFNGIEGDFAFKIYITTIIGELINNGQLKKDLSVVDGIKIDGYDVSVLGAVSHDPKILGTKEIDESGVGNNKVILYDEDSEKLIYRTISKVFPFFIS